MKAKETRKGNILLVANWESNVGYAWWLMENFWVTISRHFGHKGSKCHLIYPKITQIPAAIAASEIKSSECDFHKHSPTNLITLYNLIKKNNIKYIYLSDSPSYSLFYLLLRLWGIKQIVVHDHTPGERSIPKGWRKTIKSLIQKIPLYTADHFIAVTDFVYHRLIEVSRIPDQKCSVAPNGITPVNLNNIDAKYAHHCFDIPEQRLIVVTTGRASYYKGIDFFIHCAEELINKQKFEQLHFLFCGDGPDMKAFQLLVKNVNIENHFTFAGKRNDVPEILASCHIGLHAATGEVGYSLSILEYMSAGLATIVPDNPSTSDATRHGITGLLYKQKDLAEACEAIKKCLDETYRNKLADNAKNDIRSNYNLSQTNKSLITILNKVFI